MAGCSLRDRKRLRIGGPMIPLIVGVVVSFYQPDFTDRLPLFDAPQVSAPVYPWGEPPDMGEPCPGGGIWCPLSLVDHPEPKGNI